MHAKGIVCFFISSLACFCLFFSLGEGYQEQGKFFGYIRYEYVDVEVQVHRY